MKVEVELSPVVGATELLELARLVDEARADRLGISDVAMLRDSFLTQALCAEITQHVHIGSLVSNPYVRHPAAMATTLATLNEISGGRAFLGIGVGAGLCSLGIHQSRPAELLEEFLAVVSRLLSGEQLDWDGRHYRIRGARNTGRSKYGALESTATSPVAYPWWWGPGAAGWPPWPGAWPMRWWCERGR